MGKRFVVVGSATAVGGLVLGASIVYGPRPAESNNPSLPNDIAAPGIGDPGNPSEGGVKIFAFDYSTFELDDGQLRGMRLRAASTTLKPQGITELTRPHAEIRLGPYRAITITADKADMEMEDSKPRRGRFSGNVVVTLYEAPVGTPLVLEEPNTEVEAKQDIEQADGQPPAHTQFVQQRIYMDEATNFSIEDDTISTQGPVHVTSPQVDFFGIGLNLAYNTQRERIEQLIISEGRYLIINPDAPAPGYTTIADTNADAEQSEASGTDLQEKPDLPKQFYNATFNDDVLVRDGLESELAGQTLTIDFSLGTDAVEVKPIEPDVIGQLPRVIPIGQLAQAANAAPPALVIPPANQARTLLKHDPKRDTVVTWTGPLTVKPYETRPEALTDDEDAHLTLTGPNAYAQTIRNDELERLETNKLEYLVSEERTNAYASDERAMRILSTALGGAITGQQLTVRQAEGTATILGPGELTYTDDDTKKTLKLTWQNRLDLELYTQAKNADAEEQSDEASGTDRAQTKILGVKTATFDGDVTAKHTDFDLAASTLTLAFAKPDKANKIDNHPTAINASGEVAVQARGDAKDEVFDITAGRLSIDLKLDANNDNEPYASEIHAEEGVSVKRPGSTLTCNRVTVELNPPEPKQAVANADAEERSDEAPGTEPEEDRFAQVRTIVAVGLVRADLEDEDGRRIDLIADQLIADVENDRLTLAADDADDPAEVTDLTSGRKLTGQLIEMDDQAQQLDIAGKGSLATVLDDPNNKDAGIEDAFLAIDWSKSMAFNNVTGEATFIGSVRSESRRSIDASELTCDRLDMVFSEEPEDEPKEDKPADADAADQPAEEDEDGDTLAREIRSAVATGNVKFLASSWDVDKPNQINNRIRLEGPKVVITNQPADGDQPAAETLVVEGQGRMVLEDYRPPDKEDADNKAKLTGRGATLFSWDQTMALDALTNTATFVDGVQMVHLPKDDAGKQGDAIQLDCMKLVADLTDTGGLAGWLAEKEQGDDAKDAPDAQIESILATGNVRLLQQGTRSMRGDALDFDGEKNVVTLNANGNRDVVLEDLQRDTATRTNKITWDLTTDRIEIDQLRGGVAPLN
ncbi:MAG: hypothetical protein AAF085_08865 [Planctomycetota bacterium]